MESSGAACLIAPPAAGVALLVPELALPGVYARVPGLPGFEARADRSLSYGEAA